MQELPDGGGAAGKTKGPASGVNAEAVFMSELKLRPPKGQRPLRGVEGGIDVVHGAGWSGLGSGKRVGLGAAHGQGVAGRSY